MELQDLIEIRERGEPVVCQRFGHEAPLLFKRIEAIIPAYDKRGEPDYSAICRDSSGCQYTVAARWLQRAC